MIRRPPRSTPFACDDSPEPHASVLKVTLLSGDEDSPGLRLPALPSKGAAHALSLYSHNSSLHSLLFSFLRLVYLVLRSVWLVGARWTSNEGEKQLARQMAFSAG